MIELTWSFAAVVAVAILVVGYVLGHVGSRLLLRNELEPLPAVLRRERDLKHGDVTAALEELGVCSLCLGEPGNDPECPACGLAAYDDKVDEDVELADDRELRENWGALPRSVSSAKGMPTADGALEMVWKFDGPKRVTALDWHQTLMVHSFKVDGEEQLAEPERGAPIEAFAHDPPVPPGSEFRLVVRPDPDVIFGLVFQHPREAARKVKHG